MAWILLQAVDVGPPILEMPDWKARSVLLTPDIGAPAVLVLARWNELTIDNIFAI